MDQQQRRLDPRVAQVREELAQLRGGEHALVDDRASRQRREVGVELTFEFTTGALASHEGLAVEFDAGRPARIGDEQLFERRHRRPGRLTETVGIDGKVAPAEHAEPDVVHGHLDRRHRLLARAGIGRQERRTGRVRADRRKLEVDDGAQERIGDLDQDPGAVTGVGLGTGRSSVLHVGQRLESGHHQLVGAHALQVRDERHTARVVFVPGVVEPDRARGLLHHHIRVSRSCTVPWCSRSSLTGGSDRR
jgi:hypothetical protein